VDDGTRSPSLQGKILKRLKDSKVEAEGTENPAQGAPLSVSRAFMTRLDVELRYYLFE
jgi:hypothetical protein